VSIAISINWPNPQMLSFIGELKIACWMLNAVSTHNVCSFTPLNANDVW
jgi:hypothetical protein